MEGPWDHSVSYNHLDGDGTRGNAKQRVGVVSSSHRDGLDGSGGAEEGLMGAHVVSCPRVDKPAVSGRCREESLVLPRG